ncbi:uncharacterized protein F5891DRAFT_1147996 [Suillus fuscotomentosus]|uniref:F-box domain-containing protein n=1 Tax=Suillus fuscotomentosus TaxID=1912939 RepID=A0AAD4HJS9_9AGAM|nr:uncharacterized protein F5891DRAFT_1147996 [Suillus fuscotomentosus]KAG1898766.1 hypothetical protein F5891DRAFT_1147996 [Suillus fuscotomentosus]
MIQALKAGLLQTSFASYLPVMEPIILFPFTDLPVELAFMILEYAARPTFDQADLYDARSPYSSALALCRVSKIVRRIVLPELLHTILLPDFRHVEKFVHALRMQKVYKEKGSDLHFEYAPRVHKMWIVSHGGNPASAHLPHAPRAHALKPSRSPLDISLLAPILLAAPSLALGWTSLDILVECLEHVWKSHAATHVDNEHPPLPWKTQTLTLSCTPPTTGPQWERLTDTPQGSTFLGSISHLSANPYVCDYKSHTADLDRDYRLPLWMGITPWAIFKSLQTVFLSYPRIASSVDPFALIFTGIDSYVELLTLSASLLRDHCDCIPKEIKGFAKIGPGEECIQSDDVRLKVSDSRICWYTRDGWEKVWACML